MSTVMLLQPGNMGAAVGAGIVAAGHEVRCLLAGRSADTQARARDAGLTPANDLSGCDVVLSICPPEAAVQTALAAAGFTGLYIDANATSPDTARTIAHTVQASGATYVDGGIIGPPPTRSDTTRLYLSGPSAGAGVALFDGSVLSVRVLDGGGDFGASALKMAYAGWSKVSAALLLAALDTATAHGVGDALMAEWQISRPDVPGRVPSARDSARTKGWRWSGEMREIAKTFAAGGEPSAFGEGAAEIYSRYPRPAGS